MEHVATFHDPQLLRSGIALSLQQRYKCICCELIDARQQVLHAIHRCNRKGANQYATVQVSTQRVVRMCRSQVVLAGIRSGAYPDGANLYVLLRKHYTQNTHGHAISQHFSILQQPAA
jgi:hypothetical protein